MILRRLFWAAPLCVAMAAGAFGQYQVDWWTVDNGGGTSTGGVYSLQGTIGQPDAGVMGGGSFALTGGFWSASPAAECIGDADGDLDIDIDDLLIVLGAFGQPGPGSAGDLDADGDTDIDDLLLLLGAFGMDC